MSFPTIGYTVSLEYIKNNLLSSVFYPAIRAGYTNLITGDEKPYLLRRTFVHKKQFIFHEIFINAHVDYS